MNHFVFSSSPVNLPVMSGQPVPVRRGAARHDGSQSRPLSFHAFFIIKVVPMARNRRAGGAP